MADTKTDQEPSIEEILESIRQIISEDGTPVEAAPPKAPAPPKPATPPPAPQKAPEPPVQKAAAPPPPPPPPPKPVAPEPEPEAEEEAPQERILDLTDRIVEPAPAFPPAPIPRIALEDAMKHDAPHEEHLVSDMTADAAVAAMMKLLANNIALERELPGKPGPVTLEDMARELMRPLVKQWLDQNLQKIIEKMVAREIERLSARALENQ